MIVIYTIQVFKLNQIMKRMVGDFKFEIRSVNFQFLVFLFVYITRFVWSLFMIFDVLVSDIDDYT